MGVKFDGRTAITLTAVGAARLSVVKSPLGNGPVALVEIN
jgi:hypothetical protein